MAKTKTSLCICVLLCCFSMGVFGSCDWDSDSYECKNDANSSLTEQLKSLRAEVNQLKAQNRQDHGIWFLGSWLKGRAGKRKEKEDVQVTDPPSLPDACVLEEKWVNVHLYNNTSPSDVKIAVPATVGIKRSSQNVQSHSTDSKNSINSAGISHSDLQAKMFAHIGKSSSTGFDWTLTPNSTWADETAVAKAYICQANSSCVYKQLLGQCGKVKVPVDQFCLVSVPIGNPIPDSCNLTQIPPTSSAAPTGISKDVPSGNWSNPVPYQLSLQFKDIQDEWKHICSAVILDEKTALTAASCFLGKVKLYRYRVVAGKNLLDTLETQEQEQVLSITNITIHPNYRRGQYGNNIAILHVDKPGFQFNNKNVGGTWLSPLSNEQLKDMKAVTSGWVQFSNILTEILNSLQNGNVSIMSPKECQQKLTSREISAPGVLCALNPDTLTFYSNFGGPLVIPNYKVGDSTGNLLVGIFSFWQVFGAETKNSEPIKTVGMFTEMSHFYDWIQENRGKKPCEPNHLPCVTGGCYHEEWKCDEEEDCPDGTDEINCPEKTTTAVSMETSSSSTTPTTTGLCNETQDILPSSRATKQFIYPHGSSKKIEVLDDFETDGGGWTIIQKRSSGPEQEFNKTWCAYEKGFGSLDGNFWLGLENIRELTKNGDQELRIELEDFEGKKGWAKYSNFSISDASDFYRLEISGFDGDSSTAGDSMTGEYTNNGQRFRTWDKDNDNASGGFNCAASYGGWWFGHWCGVSHLNGPYKEKGEYNDNMWYYWKTGGGYTQSFAKTEMKIRKRKSE